MQGGSICSRPYACPASGAAISNCASGPRRLVSQACGSGMNEISDGSVRVTALRLLEGDPLLAASRRNWSETAGALGWRWETFVGEEPINPFRGSPTDYELDACTRCLLRLGRLSFLSSDAEPFRSAGHRLQETVSRSDLLGRMRKLLLKERLWLVSADHEVAMREAYFAYGRWYFGHQPMLVMDRGTKPAPEEADFLMGLLERDERRLRRRPRGMIAWVAPLVDGVGIFIVPARSGNRTRLAQDFMATFET